MTRKKNTNQARRITMVGGFAIALLASTSSGEIMSVHRNVQFISPPPDVTAGGALAEDEVMWAFNELQGVTLAADLEVDAISPGVYNQNSDLISAVISAGTRVNSHYVHTDRQEQYGSYAYGAVTFENVILGVIVGDGNLNVSNALGATNTQYPGFLSDRGPDLDSPNNDWFGISSDRRTIVMNANPGLGVDDFRIVTGAPIPTPGPLAIVGAAGACALRRRR